MKQIFLFSLSLFLMSSLAAQTELYSRVRIALNAEHSLADLARMGMEVDHGQLVRGIAFTGEFSAGELAQITEAGFSFDVLIADLTTHYQTQTGKDETAAAILRMEGECPTSVFDKQYETPENYTQGTYAGYFRYQEMLDNIDAMHAMYPNLITARAPISETLLTHEGRQIWYVRLSDNPIQSNLMGFVFLN